MNAPCTDHDNCTLNITLLRGAIKKLEATHRETARAFKECERSVHAATYDWRKHDTLRNSYRSEAWELHLLYATRAHHRGRVHAPRRADSDGTICEYDLHTQGVEVEATWGRFKRVPKTDAAA